jgi:hypothetical protein
LFFDAFNLSALVFADAILNLMFVVLFSKVVEPDPVSWIRIRSSEFTDPVPDSRRFFYQRFKEISENFFNIL